MQGNESQRLKKYFRKHKLLHEEERKKQNIHLLEDHLHQGWQRESGLAEASLTQKRRLYVLRKNKDHLVY